MSGTRVDQGINPSHVLTGAKVAFYLGDMTTPVGYATAMNYNVNHDLVPIHTLDRLAPVEYAEVSYTVNFSVTRFRTPRISGVPGSGSAVDLGWQSKLQDILTQGTIKARIFDKSTQQDLLVIDEVKLTSHSGGFAARDVSSETMEFVGILSYDEAGEQNAI